MQKIVNQIYWDTIPTTYMYGTTLKVKANNHVEFTNELMPSGKVLIKWQSMNNYQATKLIPQLPILKTGYQYRITLHAQAKPAGSVVTRLTFQNIQGNEIQRIDFRDKQEQFVFPADAVSYQISLISNGCTAIHFDRIDLCQASVPVTANSNIWFHEPINATQDQPVHILLIQDEKRARYTMERLTEYAGKRYVQPISIAWQSDKEQVFKTVTKWLQKHRQLNLRLISTSSATDDFVKQLRKENSAIEVLLANHREDSNCSDLPVMLMPDWLSIFTQIKAYWKEGQV